MKITRVAVEEYTGPDGLYAAPRLRIDLDIKRPLPRGLKVQQGDEHHVVRVEGMRYSFLGDMVVIGTHEESLFRLNRYFEGNPWVPVVVNFHTPEHQYFIPLARARRELKRWQSDWELVPSDWHAQRAYPWWRLRERDLTCRAMVERNGQSHRGFCFAKAKVEVWIRDHYIPLCAQHHTEQTVNRGRL